MKISDQQFIYDEVYKDRKRVDIYNRYHLKTFYKVFDENYFLPLVHKYIKDNKTILDLGAGGGNVSQKISFFNGRMINLDLSFNAIQYNRSRNKIKNSKFIVADINSIPLKNKSIDVVICYGSLHHIEDFASAIKEIKRVLKTNGVLIAFERLPRYSWFELWSKAAPLTKNLKKTLIDKYKKLRLKTDRKDESNSIFEGISKADKRHSSKIAEEYVAKLKEGGMEVKFYPVGIEFIPPRFFEQKSKFFVHALLRLSPVIMKIFKLQNKSMFALLEARATIRNE